MAEANRVFELERQKFQSEINKLHIEGQEKDDKIFKLSAELAKLKEDGKEYVNKIKMLGQEIQKLNSTIQSKDAEILRGVERLRNREIQFQEEL